MPGPMQSRCTMKSLFSFAPRELREARQGLLKIRAFSIGEKMKRFQRLDFYRRGTTGQAVP